MKCKDCSYFKIAYEPMMPFDMGLAICTKYNLEVDFPSKRKINRLVCVKSDVEKYGDMIRSKGEISKYERL